MNTGMKIDGGCHCGSIQYEAQIDPQHVVICHCTDCQTLSGTAFRTVVRAPGPGFRITRGTPKKYVKTAESGNKRVQAFCADCGTRSTPRPWMQASTTSAWARPASGRSSS